MDALEALFTRRSVRRFRPDPVERSEIEKIIEAGRLAATTKEKIGDTEKIGENWRKLGTHPILLKASRRIPR
jgi:nitroreductase